MTNLAFRYDDGGRASRNGSTRDCVARAVSIAAGIPYEQVYDALAAGNYSQRRTRDSGKVSGKMTADNGVMTSRKWFKDYMAGLGFTWTPTMAVGQGCTVHLRAGELPEGRLVAMVSRHAVAVIDGVIRDVYDPSRDGTRCVYGYWQLTQTRGSR
jgi:hypothetical protein